MTGVYIVLGLIALAAVCVLIIWIQAKRIKTYKSENASLRQANRDAAVRLEHIREYIAKNKIIAEEADGNRRELDQTPDSGLADRANSLFLGRDGGVREPDGGGSGT